jgi:carboxylesterase
MANVLVLHGFTSHPTLTLGPLAQTLTAAGYTLAQPTLPGHGTKPEDLRGVLWEDWYQTALDAYNTLAEPRAIVGLSMGCLLAGRLAAQQGTAALVAMVPFLEPHNKTAYLAPYVHWFMPWAKGTNSVRKPDMRSQSPNYPHFPTKTLVEVLDLQRQMPGFLPQITAPALVLEAAYDSTSAASGVRRYYELLGSTQKDYRVFAESEHDLLLDTQAQETADTVRDWLLGVFPSK